MNYEQEILKLQSELAETKKKLADMQLNLCMSVDGDKLYPTKRFYLCKLEKDIYGDRWGNWEDDKFVPLHRFINGKKYFYEFDTAEEAVEFGKNNSWGERVYVKDRDTNRVVRPKNFKVTRSCFNCDHFNDCQFRYTRRACDSWKLCGT